MRLLLFLLLLSFSATAQINRSAKQLATENIEEYIKQKLFKQAGYEALATYELHEVKNKDSVVTGWWLKHKFNIVAAARNRKWGNEEYPSYTFIFYMDPKMLVTKAERIE